MLLQSLIKIIVNFRAEKYCARCLYHVLNQTYFLSGIKYRARKRMCSYTQKWNGLKAYISLKGNNLACLQMVYLYTIWFIISEKST